MIIFNWHVYDYYLHMEMKAFWFGSDWARNNFKGKKEKEERHCDD